MSEKDNGQWYTNKELFEKINDLQLEMKSTREIIKKYNGLYKKVDAVNKKIDVVDKKTDNVDKKFDNFRSQERGKNKTKETIHQWGGWLFSFITLIVLLYTTFN